MKKFRIFKKLAVRECTRCPECSDFGFKDEEISQFLLSDKRKTKRIKNNWLYHEFTCTKCGTFWNGKLYNIEYENSLKINLRE